MFKRRSPRSLLKSLKELIYPSMGYRRAFRYIKFRLLRLPGSVHKIALGLAIGASVSFTPLIGTHIIQAAILTSLFRGSILASVIGTVIGNPATFPFMWSSAIVFGAYLFGLFGLPVSATLPNEMSLEILWSLIKYEPFRIFLPWALGGYILMVLTLPVFYWLSYNFVKGIKLAHRAAQDFTAKRSQ